MRAAALERHGRDRPCGADLGLPAAADAQSTMAIAKVSLEASRRGARGRAGVLALELPLGGRAAADVASAVALARSAGGSALCSGSGRVFLTGRTASCPIHQRDAG
jgi:hypothetical protein